MTAVPEGEVLRYLGNAPAEGPLLALIRSVTAELAREVRPRSVSRRLEISVEARAVCAAGYRFESADLAGHLRGCREAVFLAATLGATADRLLRRYAALDLPRAAVWQAACAAMLEAYLDEIEPLLLRDAPGLFPRARFSPGYGDFDISHQEAMFSLLDLERRLGVTRTAAQMMLPEKSVTAILGLADAPRACPRGCAACAHPDCPHRRNPHAEIS